MADWERRATLAHKYTIRNREQLLASTVVGCGSCCEFIDPSEIEIFMKEKSGDRTGKCPKCGVDALIGDASGVPITATLLAAMQWIWFDY